MDMLEILYRRYIAKHANNQPTEAETMRDWNINKDVKDTPMTLAHMQCGYGHQYKSLTGNSPCPVCNKTPVEGEEGYGLYRYLEKQVTNENDIIYQLRDRIEAAITKLHIMKDAYHNPDDVTDIKNIPTMNEIIATLEGRKL